jgi:hypothetical protein
MTSAEWKRIKQVAGDAWGQPEEDREAYVRTACGDDEPLKSEVMNLLRAMTLAVAFLEGLVTRTTSSV